MVLLSVIVPVYNTEKYLAKCMKSLAGQTLKDIEIICINDGSTDSSAEILNKFARNDARIKVYNNENQGQSASRNFGISVAKGKYLGFVDSDDWVDKDYFEKLYKAADKYDADIACAGFRRCKNGNGTKRKVFKKEIVTNDINEKVLLDRVPVQCYVWNKIYKRESWIKSGITFPQNKIYEDLAIILKLLNMTDKMVTVPNTYYHYRRRKDSAITTNSAEVKKDFDYASEEIKNYAKENGITLVPLNNIIKKVYLKIFGIKVMRINYYSREVKYFLFGIPIASLEIRE